MKAFLRQWEVNAATTKAVYFPQNCAKNVTTGNFGEKYIVLYRNIYYIYILVYALDGTNDTNNVRKHLRISKSCNLDIVDIVLEE